MRSAGNFHPEWGYLAPAPSFLRSMRIALVATAIGATAGAVVVVSLLGRPAANASDSSIAAHALVTGVPIVTAPAPAAPAAVNNAPAADPTTIAQAPAATTPAPASAGKPDAVATPAPSPAPASVAALTESPPSMDAAPAAHPDDAVVVPDAAPAKKSVSKRRRTAGYEAARRWAASGDDKRRSRDAGAFAPLFRLFSFSTGTSAYSN